MIAFAEFRTDALDEHADVVFPAESYAEKEGTVTHPDGRLQRVRQAIGHPGEVRAGWWVLAELCERAGAGIGALSSSPMVTAALAEAVPFYAGITLDEIGGHGVRWQEREAAVGARRAGAVDRAARRRRPPRPRACAPATSPTLWGGPETEHAPSLRFLATGPRAELSAEDARAAGRRDRRRGAARPPAACSVAVVATVRTGVPAGSVFLSGRATARRRAGGGARVRGGAPDARGRRSS